MKAEEQEENQRIHGGKLPLARFWREKQMCIAPQGDTRMKGNEKEHGWRQKLMTTNGNGNNPHYATYRQHFSNYGYKRRRKAKGTKRYTLCLVQKRHK